MAGVLRSGQTCDSMTSMASTSRRPQPSPRASAVPAVAERVDGGATPPARVIVTLRARWVQRRTTQWVERELTRIPVRWPEVREALLDGVDLETSTRCGRTILMHAVASANADVDMVRWLLARGARTDGRDQTGQTALTLAATVASVAILQALIEGGAAVDARNGTGRTALMSVPLTSRVSAIDPLVDGGADVLATRRTDGVEQTVLDFFERWGSAAQVEALDEALRRRHPNDRARVLAALTPARAARLLPRCWAAEAGLQAHVGWARSP